MRKLLFTWAMICLVWAAIAQTRKVSGVVLDQSDGTPLAGVNVQVKGTSLGTSTDTNGRFVMDVPGASNTLIISFVGFATQEVPIPESNFVTVNLVPSASELEEVVIAVGSRGPQRTITDTPLPVDNLNIRDLVSTGQITFDKTLQYRVPSFNTVNTPVNDATSLFDPYEIRNLGPSRTLILINGKRKNLTALVYTQTSPGRGETGADLTAIPIDAIKRVEILRDGASAQYGSDAIAGVMNVILKDRYEGTSVSVNTLSTLKYGGFGYGVNYNSGASFGSRGFVNYHASFQHQELTNRKDKIDPARDFADLTDGSLNAQNGVNAFLARYPDGLNKNGTPENTTARFLINSVIPMNDNTEVYGNAAYVYRKTNSFANYRQPYWRIDQGLLHKRIPGAPDYTGDDYTGGPNGAAVQAAFAADKAAGLYEGYIGYQPTFDGDLTDYNATLGLRSANLGGWKQDISLTVGGNKMLFTVENTVNRAMVKNSPIAFKPGGFAFNHLVGNIDFSRPVAEKFFVAIGSEFRSENWELIPGDTASYYSEGANSFPGFRESNAIKANRFNLGAYVDLTWDITESFLIGGTFRSELYSDFGTANVYKVVSRYKIADKLTLRGSVSTGFRAPTLHQKYLSLTQASFVGGDIVNTGLANNLSREARLLGVPRLKAERANNLALGLGFNPNNNISFTVDYYNIRIRDRIIYSNEVTDNINGVPIELISFFINAAETKTSGIDVVLSYRNLSLGAGKVAANLAGNYTIRNELVGGWEKLNSDFGYDIFNQTQESLLTTSRPKYKFILGLDYTLGKFNINLNNTLFGWTEFNNADLDENLKLRFKPKVVTDLSVAYNITSKLNASLTIQNILNVFPEYEILAENPAGEAILADPAQVRDQINNITFNGRYPVVTYDGSHFSQLGTMFQLQLNYKF
ncbi:MAG: TonB-dependent receptor [Cyclobacteriaceae bacterium]|nr:TonB-dependent receptor [Cyclobacteriaceae bacterium]MDW8330150.1 TonB-dependent receptor [Cyclobacteriaceae bacterium]